MYIIQYKASVIKRVGNCIRIDKSVEWNREERNRFQGNLIQGTIKVEFQFSDDLFNKWQNNWLLHGKYDSGPYFFNCR